MNFVNFNRQCTSILQVFCIALLLSIFVFLPNARADFDTIYFYVNGDTTSNSMVQGDEFGWGSNCEVGASIQYEIFYDANNNSTIDRTLDVLLTSEQVTDGSLITEQNPILDGHIFNGTFVISLPPGNYIVKALDLATNASIENIFSVTPMLIPINQISGTVILPGVAAPNSLLANIPVVAESETGDEGIFIAVTDNNGDYTLNLGPFVTGVELYVDPVGTDGYVAPSDTTVTATGMISNVDFTYELPVDSVYGIVKDYLGNPFPFESDVVAFGAFDEKNTSTKNSRYAIYFTEDEKGEYYLENDSRNAPFFTTELGLLFSHDTLNSFQHDITLLEADTAIYAIITEDGSQPFSNYRIDAYSFMLNTWTESISDIGSDNIVRIPVSSLDNSGWYVNVVTFDDDFPIPDGYTPQPESYINVTIGDTVSFDISSGGSGCCIGYTGNIDYSQDDGSIVNTIDIGDLVFMVNYMFRDGPEPPCIDELNVTGGSDGIDIGELIYLVNFMFHGGPPPVPCP